MAACVEFGIVMGVIAVFHFFWHSRYYLRIFARKDSIKKEISEKAVESLHFLIYICV